jgi:DNA-binding transcriptional ArsR family regulator
VCLCRYFNRETGEAWPSMAELEDCTGMRRRTVQYALRDLEAAKLVRKQVGCGRSHTNMYRLTEKVHGGAPFVPEKVHGSARKGARIGTEKVHRGAPGTPKELLRTGERPSGAPLVAHPGPGEGPVKKGSREAREMVADLAAGLANRRRAR